MEFERIGKNMIQCHISVEEMDEYGLRIEDFFTNQEKSRDFLEQLVEHAEEEVGYESESGMVSMQLMRLPDDSLVITFSEKGDDGFQNMLNQLQNLAGMLDETVAKNYSEGSAIEEVGATSEDSVQGMTSRQKKSEKTAKQGSSQGAGKKLHSKPKLFCFKNFDSVESFALQIELQKSIPSRLYKDKKTGWYYLLLKKGKLRLEEYQMLCEEILEYADHQIKQPFAEQYCKEHFQCILAKHALRTLKDYQLGADAS
ncbi:MAG: adaptor protein MecA [Lachnospiraceae bacterium]|nr:adaptor protein MecA [Lachnospiraceae bacterium]